MVENTDISKFQIGIVSETSGIAIEPTSNALVVLKRSNPTGKWRQSDFEIGYMRSVEKVKTSPEEYITSGGCGGAHGIGQAVGVAMRNSSARKKADAETGILVNLRSLETPTLFIQITDDRQRDQAFEALSQICETGIVNGQLNWISSNAVNHQRTESTLQDEENGSETSTSFGAVLVVGAVLVILIISVMSS